jgi:U3 small nucleolar RNA-associated protein 14
MSESDLVQPVVDNQPNPETTEEKLAEPEVDHDITDPFEHDLHTNLVESEANNMAEAPRASYFSQEENVDPVNQSATEDNAVSDSPSLEESEQAINEGLANQTAESESKEKPKLKSEDDSNLYSINNFSI